MKTLILLAYLAIVGLLAYRCRAESKTVGVASFYGWELAGKPMASGENFDPEAMVCASWYYPFGTKLRVINISNGKSVVVTCKDRGPNKRLGRLIDLSLGAFRKIADTKDGLCTVQILKL